MKCLRSVLRAFVHEYLNAFDCYVFDSSSSFMLLVLTFMEIYIFSLCVALGR